MWLGADPRSKGPTLDDLDDPDAETTALEEACTNAGLDVLKRLKPDPHQDDLGNLLRVAGSHAQTATITYLLDFGADANDKPDGSSTALDGCLRYIGWEHFYAVRCGRQYRTPAYQVATSRQAIRALVERGAIWKPGDSIKQVRRSLYAIDPEVTVELVGLLAKHHACDQTALQKLLRTPRMQQHIASCERALWRLGLTLDGRPRPATMGPPNAPPSPYLLSRYDREQLFGEVWSEPAETVATRYGISGVALGKVCRQLRIPKPPRGHWAKKAAGRPLPPRPKLPPLKLEAAGHDTGRSAQLRDARELGSTAISLCPEPAEL